MEIASVAIGAVGGIILLYASVFASIHRDVALWINFVGATLMLFGAFLFAQDKLWDSDAEQAKTKSAKETAGQGGKRLDETIPSRNQRPWLQAELPRLVKESRESKTASWKVAVTNTGDAPATILRMAFCRADRSAYAIKEDSLKRPQSAISMYTMDFVHKNLYLWNGMIVMPNATVDVGIIGLDANTTLDYGTEQTVCVEGLILYSGRDGQEPSYSTECLFVYSGEDGGFQMAKFGNSLTALPQADSQKLKNKQPRPRIWVDKPKVVDSNKKWTVTVTNHGDAPARIGKLTMYKIHETTERMKEKLTAHQRTWLRWAGEPVNVWVGKILAPDESIEVDVLHDGIGVVDKAYIDGILSQLAKESWPAGLRVWVIGHVSYFGHGDETMTYTTDCLFVCSDYRDKNGVSFYMPDFGNDMK